MQTSLTNAAELWEKVYKAFEGINFTAYDYDAVKQSLLEYLKVHYPENFNDYIESSQLIAIVESFAYVAEIMAYRVDMSVHENMISTASRKQSVLRLAKLVSYSASRNLPLRGLLKITGISISENLTDSQGNSLTNRIVKWADQSNPLWREHFYTVINRVLTQSIGNPFKSFQIDDTVFQQYELNNVVDAASSSFQNGVIKFRTKVNNADLDFEIVPADIDQGGVFEREPNPNLHFNILFADDGYGDGSDTTGFMMYLKQGSLKNFAQFFDLNLPNRTVDIPFTNVNDVDVWVQEVDSTGVVIDTWTNVPNVNGNNLIFNNLKTFKKYEIETLEDDKIRLIFGDGDFAAIPTGNFNIWVRTSSPTENVLLKSQIIDQTMTFAYTSKTGKQESCTISYSLTSTLQNSSASEDIQHIRTAAPSVYYTQNRMVNGEDYNSLFLKDPSILRLKTVNRTFSGQPKYIEWNDASGAYQNVKIFGNDLRMYYDLNAKGEVSKISARSLIDEYLEPALSSPEISNLITYTYSTIEDTKKAFVKSRTKFLDESVNGELVTEKTEIQGALDRHWYGEPDRKVMLDINLSDSSSLSKSVYGVVTGTKRVYDASLKLVTASNMGYELAPYPGGISGIQESVIRQKKFGIRFDPEVAFSSNIALVDIGSTSIVDSISIAAVNLTTRRSEVYTIEITDSEGNFSVHSSLDGYHASGKVDVPYTNGYVSFLVRTISSDLNVAPGDAFIFEISNVFVPSVSAVSRANLYGRFKLIDETILPENAIELAFDPSNIQTSWIFIIERVDDAEGNLAYWSITKRGFNLVVESPTTKFWYSNDNGRLIDPDTKLPVYDSIRVLKSNLDAKKNPIVTDQIYNVVGTIKHLDGEINVNALSITPAPISDVITTNYEQNRSQNFLSFIGDDNYVYFKEEASTGRLIPISTTSYIQSLNYVNGRSGSYVRKLGRDNLDFMWQHFTPSSNLVDPSTTNINDMYILTRSYYSKLRDYVNEVTSIAPTLPTSLELRNSYRNMVELKMISDTVIMHPGKIKLLFGSLADPELRATFKIIKKSDSRLTAEQIRSRVLNLISDYFKIENWDFGQSFYITDLYSEIHNALPTEIASIALVPMFPFNYFGDMYHIRSAPDEVFMSCARLENIEVVTDFDRVVLKQKG